MRPASSSRSGPDLNVLYVIEAVRGEPRYIGVTRSDRLVRRTWEHRTSNHHHVRHIMAAGGKLRVIGKFDTREEAMEAEVKMIALAHEAGLRIVNMTSGGDGVDSESARAVQMARTPEQRAEIKRRANRARTPEDRKRIAINAQAHSYKKTTRSEASLRGWETRRKKKNGT